MKIPKPWRTKRGKKYIGAYHVTLDGERINLRTQDANEALKRAKLAAQHGKRDFRDDAQEAAAATVDALTTTEPAPIPALEPTPPPPPAAPAQPQPPTQAIPSPPPDEPRASTPAAGETSPAAQSTAGWADDAHRAAEETAGSSDNQAPPPPQPQIDPAVAAAMFKVLAQNFVIMQLQLQARIITWRTGKICKPLPQTPEMGMAMQMATDSWAEQLRIWIPLDAILPPWALAMICVGSIGFVQFAMAEKPKAATPGAQPIRDAEFVTTEAPAQQAT